MLFFYKILTSFFYPIFLAIIYLRKILNKEDNLRFKEKIFKDSQNIIRGKESKLFWFHCASIGEMMSVAPLVEYLSREKNKEILITTVTLSSSELFKKKFVKYSNVQHRFFPLDNLGLVKNFLNKWSPNIILFVDSEIWPNFLTEIKKRSIPLILLNARITDKSFSRWSLFKNFSKKIFGCFSVFICASKNSKTNLEKLGQKNTKYFGNLKFSSTLETNEKTNLNELKNSWCAVSTHEGEEEICIRAHLMLKKEFKECKTIIIPRHIDRLKGIIELCKKNGLGFHIVSQNDLYDKNKEIIIVNQFGILRNYFQICKNVFIGKSLLEKFINSGGQNPIEAAKMGCKIFYGQYVYNFKDVYDHLNELNIATKVKNIDDLVINLSKSFGSEKSVEKDNIEKLNNFGQKILEENINIIKEHDSN